MVAWREAERHSIEQIREQVNGANPLACFLWNSTREGMAWVTADGTMQLVNPSFARMLGYGVGELQGRKFEEITAPQDVAPDVEQFRRLLRGEIDSYEFVKAYRRKPMGQATCRLKAIDYHTGILVVGSILPVDVLSLEALPDNEAKRVLAMLVGRWAIENWKTILTVLFALIGVIRIDDILKFFQ